MSKTGLPLFFMFATAVVNTMQNVEHDKKTAGQKPTGNKRNVGNESRREYAEYYRPREKKGNDVDDPQGAPGRQTEAQELVMKVLVVR